MNDTAILFCCHFIDPKIKSAFSRLKRNCAHDFDVYFSYDNTKSPEIELSCFSKHVFNLNILKNHGYKFAEESTWFHIDYPIIDFFLKNPNYTYYWRIEYDVRFFGNWHIFFDYFAGSDADIIATYIRNFASDPNWYWWKAINIEIDRSDLIGMFFPVVRFSNTALRLLHEKYRSGICGYPEVTVPTLSRLNGLKLQDIGKQFYNFLTFSFDGLVFRIPGKLLHPIKKSSLRGRMRGTLRGLIQKRIP